MNTEKRSQNPYVGPRAFKEGEPLFGRGLEELQLFQLLVARRIALLHSPSGAGKTSLIQARLIPKLKADGFNVLPIARLNEKPPESPPPANGFNRYIYSLLLSLQERSEDRLDEKLATLSLSEYLEAYSSMETDSELMVLIIDQFEEVLTADPTDIDQKNTFFTQVGRVLRKSNLWALFVIREDYLGALEPYVRAIPTRLSNTFRLDLLGTAAASDAIRKPAEIQGVQFTDQAVETLVDDLRRIQVQQPDGKVVEQPGLYVEPVQLQVVCHRLWQELSPGQTEITEEDLKAVGNVDKSLAAYYADRVEAIEADPEISVRERDIRKWVHNKLITKDEIRVPVLKGQGQTEGLDNRVVSMLEDAHLIRAEERAGMTWYELAHDRLVKPVRDDNVKWFNKHLSLLQRQAQRWQKEGGPDYLLLRGQALERAEDWAELHPDEFSENDQAFLEASRKEREREEEKRAAKIRELELQQQLALAEEQRKRAEEAEARQKAEEARAEEAALRAEEAETAKNRYRRLSLIVIGILAVALCLAVLAVASLNRAAEAQAAEATAAAEVTFISEVLAATDQAAEAQAAVAQTTAEASDAQATAAPAATTEAQAAVDSTEATATAATAEAQDTATASEAQAAVATAEVQVAAAAAAAVPPTSPSEGDDWTRPEDRMEMVYVTGGTFTMGSDSADDNPLHDVELDGFWIDRTEVTNKQFATFVADTGYETTAEEQGYGEIYRDGLWQRVPDANWKKPFGSEEDRELGEHPVVQVSWVDASKYCTWAGGRLPMEAQWEYAARGPDNRVYPWGDEWDGTRLNYCDRNCPLPYRDTGQDGYARTAPVASYPEGNSWIGAADMAGNVWEWVADWYGENYYDVSPLEYPTGPDSGTEKVVRGGGWSTTDKFVQSGNRHWVPPTDRRSNRGFRCAIIPGN